MRRDFVSLRVRIPPQGSYESAAPGVGAPPRPGPADPWRRLGGRALAALFASACLGCGGALAWSRCPLLLCTACERELRAPAEPACRGCGRPLLGMGATAADALALVCGGCRQQPPAWHALAAAYLYRRPLVGVVRALKFRRAEHLGAALAAPLATRCRALDAAIDVVVPVPLAWTRLLARGYNQAEAIAAPLAADLGLPMARLLRRQPRPRQALLRREQRRRNLRGAFTVRERARRDVPLRTVLLVDDVMTTGATLAAAAAALRRAGVGRVVAAVAARTPEASWDETAQ